MDNLTRQIADFAADLKYDQLPAQVVAAGTRSLVDALACAIGAHDCEPARMGLRLARGAVPERFPGRIICHGEKSSAESAAFGCIEVRIGTAPAQPISKPSNIAIPTERPTR